MIWQIWMAVETVTPVNCFKCCTLKWLCRETGTRNIDYRTEFQVRKSGWHESAQFTTYYPSKLSGHTAPRLLTAFVLLTRKSWITNTHTHILSHVIDLFISLIPHHGLPFLFRYEHFNIQYNFVIILISSLMRYSTKLSMTILREPRGKFF